MSAWLALLALLAIGAAALAEIALRLKGVGDFPLFARDSRCVYRMAASQRGRFLNRHSWCYDEFGMRHDRGAGPGTGTTILIGDSIVEGGLHLGQDDTLAAVMAGMTGDTVYPVACHGWALANELAALAGLPGWTQASRIVWLINSGDLDSVGEGESEFSFPTSRPLWLGLWLARRHLYRRNYAWWPWRRPDPERRASPTLRHANLQAFRDIASQFAKPIVLVRYPMRGADEGDDGFTAHMAHRAPGTRLIDLGACREWAAECYLDHIHPNAHGVRVLSRIIAAELGKGGDA